MGWLTRRVISLRHMKECFIASTCILGFKNADNVKHIRAILKPCLLFTESYILDICLCSNTHSSHCIKI